MASHLKAEEGEDERAVTTRRLCHDVAGHGHLNDDARVAAALLQRGHLPPVHLPLLLSPTASPPPPAAIFCPTLTLSPSSPSLSSPPVLSCRLSTSSTTTPSTCRYCLVSCCYPLPRSHLSHCILLFYLPTLTLLSSSRRMALTWKKKKKKKAD